MSRSLSTLSGCGLLGLVAFSACGVDDRALVFEYGKLAGGGSPSNNGGGEAAGDSNTSVGEAGSGATSNGDEAGAANGGTIAAGGSPQSSGGASVKGGASNAGSGGVTSSGGVAGSVGGGGATGGNATGGTSASSAGSAGSAGVAVSFPCGDLNQDSIDDCDQTLVQNSRFDAAVNGWDAEPSTNQAWDANNATGSPGSGSVKVSNTASTIAAVGTLVAGSHQCVRITPMTNYDFAARVMLAAGETTGQAGINVWLFDDDACQGNLVTGNSPIVGGVAGSWTVLTGKLWVPAGVRSMWVRLVAIKPFTQPSLSVLIDDVLVAKR